VPYTISEADQKKLQAAFTYSAPKPDQTPRYEHIRTNAKAMAEHWCMECPAGRELSLALTNLEQAVMWAYAAIARNE